MKIGYNPGWGVVELSGIELHLNPFEEKIFPLQVFEIEPINNRATLTVAVRLQSLIPFSDVKIFNRKSNTWVDSIVFSLYGNESIPLDVKITNNYYSEMNTDLLIDLTLQQTIDNKASTMSYYGDLRYVNGKYYLLRPVEAAPSRILKIDIIPEGAAYNTYLAYSHGNSLIILDNGNGIPVPNTETV